MYRTAQISKAELLSEGMPNIQNKNLFSVALNRFLAVQTTASVLRNIRKFGGLDAYLFKTKPDVLGEPGLFLRRSVQAAHEERKKMGIACDEVLNKKIKTLKEASSV